MNFAKKMAFVVVLSMVACFNAAAQDHTLKFKLTHEAHIGKSTLPPGEYRLTVYTDTRPMMIISAQDGRSDSVIALPITYESNSSCKTSSLTLTSSGGEWNVSSVCLGSLQTAMYFPAAKGRKTQVATQTTDAVALAGAQ